MRGAETPPRLGRIAPRDGVHAELEHACEVGPEELREHDRRTGLVRGVHVLPAGEVVREPDRVDARGADEPGEVHRPPPQERLGREPGPLLLQAPQLVVVPAEQDDAVGEPGRLDAVGDCGREGTRVAEARLEVEQEQRVAAAGPVEQRLEPVVPRRELLPLDVPGPAAVGEREVVAEEGDVVAAELDVDLDGVRAQPQPEVGRCDGVRPLVQLTAAMGDDEGRLRCGTQQPGQRAIARSTASSSSGESATGARPASTSLT